MPTYNFQAYKGRAEHRFTCPSCGKGNRTRSFTVEHTASPFNKNADGSVRTPMEAMRNAQDAARVKRDNFLKEPLCASCEEAMTYDERRALNQRRAQP